LLIAAWCFRLPLVAELLIKTEWLIAFGEPVDLAGYGPEAAGDPATVLELSEKVRSAVQAMLCELLRRRRTLFF